MICPECNGKKIIEIPYLHPEVFNIFYCPTCEGEGELPDAPATNWCPACGEPIPDDKRWCDFHKAAEQFIDIQGDAQDV